MFLVINKIILLLYCLLYLDGKVFAEPSVPKPKRYHRGTKDLQHSIYGKLFTRRINMATQAGYTNNPDTCKLYNDNLAEVWTVLSKFLATDQEMPDSMALHNIVLLIKAYTDHHSLVKNDENVRPENDNYVGSVPETLKEIKVMLEKRTPEKDEEMPIKIITIIKTHIKKFKGKKQEICYESNEERLKINVVKEYQRYIEFSNCGRVNNSRKRISRFEKTIPSYAKRSRWEEDPETDCGTVARNTFLDKLRKIINGYVDDYDVMCSV